MNKLLRTLIFVSASAMALNSFGATVATDTASDATYTPAWDSTDNGGTGFGTWTLATTGTGGSYIGGTGQGGTSFGLFSGTSGTSTAERPFTGSLLAGQTFSVDLGHTTNIANGNDIGLLLLDGGATVFTLKFVGGQANWLLNDGGTDFGSGQAYSANTSISFSFTYEGSNDYSYTFGTGAGSNFTATNIISGIDGVRFFNNNQGDGENLGFNNLSVIPETSSIAMLGLTGLAAGMIALLKRRKRA